MMPKDVPTRYEEKIIGYLSTFPPRECGIGVYTKHLIDGVESLNRFKSQYVVAINEKHTIYNYEKRVKWQIMQDRVEDYANAAEYVNSSKIDLLSIQHEFGIFGGEWGEYINGFINNVKKPVLTTLHSVEHGFPAKARDILEGLAAKSASVVVMANAAKEILTEYAVPPTEVQVIQHGSPDIPFVPSDSIKPSLGLAGRVVLSTFGLISRGKGIEYVIRALPAIVAKEPRILYLVIGETHPEVRRAEGETYRVSLLNLVSELGLEKHVRFHNRFLMERELIRYLQATDIYLIPYLSPNQVSSGTLVYAVGAGKAVVSTPFLHAKEVLAEGRGILCEFKNSESIAQSTIKLLEDKQLKKNIERKAYSYGRGFTWQAVARKYAALFSQIMRKRRS